MATKQGRYVFNLPPAQAGVGVGREIELKTIERSFYQQLVQGALAAHGSSESGAFLALGHAFTECHKASLVRLGTERVSGGSEGVRGEQLYYKLNPRELVGLRKCYDKIHRPTSDDLEAMIASAVYTKGLYSFEAPVALGDPTEDAEGTPLSRCLIVGELNVEEAERIGNDVLRNDKGTSEGLAQLEKQKLMAASFVSLDGFEGAPESMSQRDYAIVERAYLYAHAPSQAEIELASGSMRPA